MVRHRVLEKGVHLLLDRVSTTDAVSAGFWFCHGSRDENPEERGFSHFMEHMLFKGTESRSAFQIAVAIDRVGGFLNAFTERESTCFYTTLASEHLPLAIDVLADMVFHSQLDPGEIEKEKSVVLNEILSAKDSSEEMAHEAYLAAVWGDHDLAARITGDVPDIQRIDRARLVSFYRKFYTPANLIVSVAGNFDTDMLLDLLEEAFAGEGEELCVIQRRAPTQSFSWDHVNAPYKKVQIYTGTSLPMDRGNLSPLYDTLVFSTAVGESMSSRLFQEVRENQALCYSISSFRSLYSDAALWSIYANTTPEQAPVLLNALNGELRRLHEEPLTDQEVDDAKSHLQGSLILTKEDMEARMKRLFRQFCLFGKAMEYSESLDHIDSVTVAGARKVTADLVKSSRFCLLAYGGRRIKGFQNRKFDF